MWSSVFAGSLAFVMMNRYMLVVAILLLMPCYVDLPAVCSELISWSLWVSISLLAFCCFFSLLLSRLSLLLIAHTLVYCLLYCCLELWDLSLLVCCPDLNQIESVASLSQLSLVGIESVASISLLPGILNCELIYAYACYCCLLCTYCLKLWELSLLLLAARCARLWTGLTRDLQASRSPMINLFKILRLIVWNLIPA